MYKQEPYNSEQNLELAVMRRENEWLERFLAEGVPGNYLPDPDLAFNIYRRWLDETVPGVSMFSFMYGRELEDMPETNVLETFVGTPVPDFGVQAIVKLGEQRVDGEMRDEGLNQIDRDLERKGLKPTKTQELTLGSVALVQQPH